MSKKIGRRELLKRAATTASAGVLGTTFGANKAHAALSQLAANETQVKVPRKELGSTGIEIPVLVMGCSQKFDPVYDKTLHRAFQKGIDYLDTAQVYANGMSHKTLAPFIQQVGRENLWITSKVALPGKVSTPEKYTTNIDKMLPTLGVDHLDMFFMHNVTEMRQLDAEFIEMAADLKKRGIINHFGFSCHMGNVVDLMNKAAELGSDHIDAVMFRYNFTKYGDLELNNAIDACKNAGIGLIAMKTQASVPDDQEEVKQFRSEKFSLAQAKLKAVWADDRIDAAVSEMTNVQHVAENTEAAISTDKLAMREYMQLNQFAARSASQRCQGCNEICESRIDGDLQVADTLRFLMYAECYGNPERARELYAGLQPGERYFDGVDLRNATAACPQGIDIAKRLDDARRILA